MVRLIICGCNGRMGRATADICSAQPDLEIAAGIDLLGGGEREFPVYSSLAEFHGAADVVIDFSSPAALEGLLEFGVSGGVPLVLATTGYSALQQAAISRTSAVLPIFRSANLSFGANVLLELVRSAVQLLGDGYDLEIVERHHRGKADAPSGTALLLAAAAAEALSEAPACICGRRSARQTGGAAEIGISSVRGGGIVGDHEVIFAGRDEVIELRHSAMNREAFASGAVRAARFLSGVESPGLYTMSDLLKSSRHPFG